MARTTATNFAGALQFPYATAAADIFKKEDVQTLALAVDQHTHGAGLGLPLAAGAIPDGSITSAKIADGTIATTDLAAGAVTSLLGVYQNVATFSTTTTGTYVATPVGVTTPYDGVASVFVTCTCVIGHSALGGIVYAAIYRNASVVGAAMAVYQAAVAGENKTLFLQVQDVPPSGTHTWQLYLFNNNAGTVSMNGSVYATMQVLEWKR